MVDLTKITAHIEPDTVITASMSNATYKGADGTVSFSGIKGSYGNLIIVDHGNGVETWYGHCSKLYAKVGDAVTAGDVIEAVGSTGNSTGPHLHFEIRINGECVNPQNYVYYERDSDDTLFRKSSVENTQYHGTKLTIIY